MLASMGVGGEGGLGGFGAPPPPPAANPETAFAGQLQQLADMGFTDRAANIRALQVRAGGCECVCCLYLASHSVSVCVHACTRVWVCTTVCGCACVTVCAVCVCVCDCVRCVYLASHSCSNRLCMGCIRALVCVCVCVCVCVTHHPEHHPHRTALPTP